MISGTPGAIASRRPYIVAGVGFLVAMVDGYDTLMLAFIAPLISKEWALHPQIVGAIFASSYAGAALGATAIGIAADRFGRKTMLLASLALVGVFTILCARSANPAQLMVLRALAGLGLGGALSTSIALIAESTPVHRRRATVTRMFLGFPVGAMVGGAATAAVMSFLGWRGVFVGGGVCALLLIPLVAIGVTESESGAPAAARVHSRRPLTELVSGGRAWSTVLFCASVFLMLLTSYFLVSWIPTVLTLNGMSPGRAAMAAVVINCGGIVGTLILSFIIGRRSPLAPVVVCLCSGAILIALLGHGVFWPGNTKFLLIFAVGLAVIGAQGCIPALGVHLYPASVYATAGGLSVACGRLGSIIGPLVGGYLVSARLGWDRLFLLAAVPAMLAAVAMAALALSGQREVEPR
ncbi:MAG TPA: MFS transporter [Steroidobacteraceae bacterium]|jgi:AAHS family 4-hydroxybenzoate transporter-like MFS transporter